MLIDFETGKTITSVPFAADFHRFLRRLSASEISAIQAELDKMIDTGEIHTAGWMPGSDWRSTPFQPIYEKAALYNPDTAAKCFGLFVWEAFMARPEKWASGRFEKDGEPIGSRTYFRVA